MRRSRLDVRFGRHAAIGHRYRRRDDGEVWTITQVYRADCAAMIRSGDATRLVTFNELRSTFRWIVDRERAA